MSQEIKRYNPNLVEFKKDALKELIIQSDYNYTQLGLAIKRSSSHISNALKNGFINGNDLAKICTLLEVNEADYIINPAKQKLNDNDLKECKLRLTMDNLTKLRIISTRNSGASLTDILNTIIEKYGFSETIEPDNQEVEFVAIETKIDRNNNLLQKIIEQNEQITALLQENTTATKHTNELIYDLIKIWSK